MATINERAKARCGAISRIRIKIHVGQIGQVL